MSLRERLAQKARRTVVVPVAVTDPTGATSRVQELQVQTNLAGFQKDEAKESALKEQLVAAQAKLAECYEQVTFQTADPVDFERLQATYFSDDDKPVDVDSALPELVSICAVEADLQDSEWWAAQFKGGSWSFGERNDLWRRLLNLNSQAPDQRIPFA